MAPRLCRGPKDAERPHTTVRIAGLSLPSLQKLRDEALQLRDVQGLWVESGRLYGSKINPRPGGEELTTGDVFVECVLPKLKANPALRTYAEFLDLEERAEEDTPNTGIATIYCIHTWNEPFANTISAIETASLPNDYFFLDVACENFKVLTGQRISTVRYLTGSFEQRIAKVGRSLVILSPWIKPDVLSRTWSMFEILLTSTNDAELLVATPSAYREDFEWSLVNDFANVAARLAQLDIEKCKASSEFSHESMIQTLVRRDGGTRPGSARIASALRHALLEHQTEFLATDAGKKLVGKSARPEYKVVRKEDEEHDVGTGIGSAILGFFTRWLGTPVGLNDAEVVARTAMTTREITYGKNHPHTLVAVNHLAMVLDGLDRTADAEVLFRRSLATKEASLGKHHLETLVSAYNLAEVLEKKGTIDSIKESEELLRRVLLGREVAVGQTHPITLQAAHALASVLIRRAETDGHTSPAKLEEAARLLRRAIAGREKTLGKDNGASVASMHALARVFDAQGKADEGELWHRNVLESREKSLGPLHPDTLASTHDLGVSLHRQLKLQESDAVLTRAYAGREETLGPWAPETLASLDALAAIKFKRGNWGHAETNYRKCLEARSSVLGPEHPDTLITAHNLAVVLIADEEYVEAEKLLRICLAGQEKVLGVDSEHSLLTSVKLARVLRKVGTRAKMEESAAILRRALVGYENKMGREHGLTLVVVNDLAVSIESLGEIDEAVRLLRRALYGREKQFGTDDAETLESATSLANVLVKKNMLEAAEALSRRVLAARTTAHGPNAESSLESTKQLARIVELRGYLDEAETLYVTAIEGTIKTKGEAHPDVKVLRQNLAAIVETRLGAEAADKVRAGALPPKRKAKVSHEEAKQQSFFGGKGKKAILQRGASAKDVKAK